MPTYNILLETPKGSGNFVPTGQTYCDDSTGTDGNGNPIYPMPAAQYVEQLGQQDGGSYAAQETGA